jgi:hypothetical protein
MFGNPTENPTEHNFASVMQAFRAIGVVFNTSLRVRVPVQRRPRCGEPCISYTIHVAQHHLALSNVTSNVSADFPLAGHLAFPDTKISGHEVVSYPSSAGVLGPQSHGLFVIWVGRIDRNSKLRYRRFPRLSSLSPLPS